MIANKNETKALAEHILCDFQCKFNSAICNCQQKLNNRTSQCGCKN